MPQNSPFSIRRGPRLLAALTLAVAVGGCATQPGGPSSGVVAGQPGEPLDDNLSGFLAQAPGGSVLALAESPWGNQVEVMADEPYLAASGRECRRLRITHTGSAQLSQAVACQNAQGWETRRLVTEALAGGGRR